MTTIGPTEVEWVRYCQNFNHAKNKMLRKLEMQMVEDYQLQVEACQNTLFEILSLGPLDCSKRFASYKQYLKSPEWARLKRIARAIAVNKCQVCNSSQSLEVHHRTYARIGNELVSDLIVLCGACHALFHKHGRIERQQP